MTSSGSDARGGTGDRPDWPFGPVGGEAAAPRTTPPGSASSGAAGTAPRAGATAGSGTGDPTGTRTGTASPDGSGPAEPAPAGRRPPVWVLVLAGVLLVGAVVAAVLLLRGRGGEAGPAPEAEVVTLPLPTPTVEPIAREGGTAFSQALPATVLAYALAEAGEHVPFLAAGALEGYRHVYTDGASSVVLLAGQWETPEEASTTYAATVQAQTAAVAATGAGDAGDGEATEEGEDAEDAATSTDVEEGPVTTADGTETGRYTLVPRGDGTATLTWWNGTVMLQLDGPVEDVPDLFTGFTL